MVKWDTYSGEPSHRTLRPKHGGGGRAPSLPDPSGDGAREPCAPSLRRRRGAWGRRDAAETGSGKQRTESLSSVCLTFMPTVVHGRAEYSLGQRDESEITRKQTPTYEDALPQTPGNENEHEARGPGTAPARLTSWRPPGPSPPAAG